MLGCGCTCVHACVNMCTCVFTHVYACLHVSFPNSFCEAWGLAGTYSRCSALASPRMPVLALQFSCRLWVRPHSLLAHHSPQGPGWGLRRDLWSHVAVTGPSWQNWPSSSFQWGWGGRVRRDICSPGGAGPGSSSLRAWVEVTPGDGALLGLSPMSPRCWRGSILLC